MAAQPFRIASGVLKTIAVLGVAYGLLILQAGVAIGPVWISGPLNSCNISTERGLALLVQQGLFGGFLPGLAVFATLAFLAPKWRLLRVLIPVGMIMGLAFGAAVIWLMATLFPLPVLSEPVTAASIVADWAGLIGRAGGFVLGGAVVLLVARARNASDAAARPH